MEHDAGANRVRGCGDGLCSTFRGSGLQLRSNSTRIATTSNGACDRCRGSPFAIRPPSRCKRSGLRRCRRYRRRWCGGR